MLFVAGIAIVELVFFLVLLVGIHAFFVGDISIYSFAAIAIFMVWLCLVVGYLAWAIYFYNINLGLTDESWADIKRRQQLADSMIRNYFTTAIRSIQRSAGFSFINLIGLAIGLASCIFIFLWINDELSYDRYLSNSDRIYRIILKDVRYAQPRTPHPVPLAMVADFPEVTNGVSISPIWGTGLTRPEFTVEYNNHKFEEKGFLSADSTFFQVFQFPFVAGDPATALKKPMGIVITQSMAKKYFGDEPAIGKVLKIEGTFNLEVTAVIKDIPANTHFTFDFLISYVSLKARDRMNNNGSLSDYYTWNDFGHYNYIVLALGVDPKTVEKKMATWIWTYVKLTPEQQESIKENNTQLLLQPITSIHLHSNMRVSLLCWSP